MIWTAPELVFLSCAARGKKCQDHQPILRRSIQLRGFTPCAENWRMALAPMSSMVTDADRLRGVRSFASPAALRHCPTNRTGRCLLSHLKINVWMIAPWYLPTAEALLKHYCQI